MIQAQAPSLSYTACGLFRTDEPWIHPSRVESTYEIICVSEGAVCLREGERVYHLGPGDLVILLPGVRHEGCEGSRGRTGFYWVHFSAPSLEAFGVAERVTPAFPNLAIFRQLLHVANTPEYPAYAPAALITVLLAEIAAIQAQMALQDCQVARDAAEYIRINARRRLTAGAVARQYGYSGEHLTRLFRRAYGTGLKAYICEARMKAARELMANSPFTVKEVAQMLDFDDENQFIQFFKYHQHQTPTKFRNALYNTHLNNR